MTALMRLERARCVCVIDADWREVSTNVFKSSVT